MRRWPALGLLLGAAMAMQGCVALVLPVAAAGTIGKKQVDKARFRAREAEASFDPAAPAEVIVGDLPVETVRKALPETAGATASDDIEMAGTISASDRLASSNITNAYLPFARYAVGQAEKRSRGGTVRSAVLVEHVSLTQPQAVSCDAKPMAAIIDLDVAPGTPAEMDIERQNGFAVLLDTMRESGIRIAWLAEADEQRLKPIIDLLREGEAPVLRDTDLMLVGLPGNYRKQERRWSLAQNYCVIAIAGDRKSDFDELYDYLRDQSYAIRLEAFIGRGWFELPHPVAAIDSDRLAISPEQKAKE